MSASPSTGMKAVAVLSVIFGGMIAIGNTTEVIRGRTFDDLVVDTPRAVLALAAASFAVLLLIGGIGTWKVQPYGKKMSLIAATGTIVLNGLASVFFGVAFKYFLLGSIYPVILFVLFTRPAWKAVFDEGA